LKIFYYLLDRNIEQNSKRKISFESKKEKSPKKDMKKEHDISDSNIKFDKSKRKLKAFKKKYLKIINEEAFDIKVNKQILNEKESSNLKLNNVKNVFSLINDINADLDDMDIDIDKITKKKYLNNGNNIPESQDYNTKNKETKKNKDIDTVNYGYNNQKNKTKKNIYNDSNNYTKNPFDNNMYIEKSKVEENKEGKNNKSNIIN
jgi:hypothetical protein